MKIKNQQNSRVIVLILTIFFTGISGCEEDKDIQNWIDNTSQLRGKAEDQLPNTPYRRPQHEAFKGYFGELNQMVLTLKNDQKFRERFNEAAGKINMDSMCRKVFVSRDCWGQLFQNCTKNRFFLCAEEVRAYSELVRGFRTALEPNLQRRFDQAVACQVATH